MSPRFWIGFAVLMAFAASSGRYFKLAAQNAAPGRQGKQDYTGFFSRRDNFTDLGWRYRQRGTLIFRVGMVVFLMLALFEAVVEWTR